jgi:asparagine synthase (glutamine-hydrolysing)
MCGFTGILDCAGETRADELEHAVRRMTATVVHRGPDDEGLWADPAAGIALGFRRLSIIDRSRNGHQPMLSPSGRYVLVFNGEIYNFAELRRALESEGAGFRGRSDSEVLLSGIERWGIDETLSRANGMFAIALWDRNVRRLSLARDRIGEKPLYYGWSGRTLVFGSELKSVIAHGGVSGAIDRAALGEYLQFGWIGPERSIYATIRKVPPGTIVTVEAGGSAFGAPVPFWSAHDAARAGVDARVRGTRQDSADRLDALLRDAVRMRMVADVPLGAFLSGGVDSSTIVALMQEVTAAPVRTFTIGFDDATHDEASHGKEVAAHLGTEHTELYVTPRDAIDVIPTLPGIFDEPFADPSAIPTALLARLTRAHVTVSLSGDGGDELFSGYERYFRARKLHRFASPLPLLLRRAIATALTRPDADSWDRVGATAARLAQRSARRDFGHKVHRGASVLAAPTSAALYGEVFSIGPGPGELLVDWEGIDPALVLPSDLEFTEQMMFCDLVNYLPDDILVKLDRATMAASLEGRVPFLDHRVVEFAWTIPMEHKVVDGRGKAVLRDVLARYVPRDLFERPKMGFGVPIDTWLRGPLRDWAGDLLAPDRLRAQGIMRPERVQRLWAEHQSGTRNWQYILWAVLMLQGWIDTSIGDAR